MNGAVLALRQILPALDGKVKVFDYGDPKDFETLWSLSGLPTDRLLIVWGRTPGDGELWPIDASACLSPIDWAVAYAKHLADSTDGEGQVHLPQILVLDAITNRSPVPPSLEHFRTLNQRQLPWLRVPESPGLSDIKEWLAANPVPHDETSAQSLKRFLREIRLNITEVRSEGDYDRHAISNIVAPMVLLGRTVKKSRHSTALLALLHAAGLCPLSAPTQQDQVDHSTGSGPAATPPATGPESGKIRKDQRPLSVLLVDDQAKQGWEDWMKECLSDETSRLVTSVDPNDLVERISTALGPVKNEDGVITGYGHKDARFSLNLPGLDRAENPVLLLDLRLFAGNPAAEWKFYKETLLPLVDHFTEKSHLAWAGFTQNNKKRDRAFRDAKAAVLRGKLKAETPQHREVLTWLPRVVALADMSLPIILFSSTGRRDLVEPFKEYGNIITLFEKPRLTDLAALGEGGADIRESTAASLQEAMVRARKWLEFREAGKTALQESLANSRRLPPANGERLKHFEIYFDESGSLREEGFRVAALLVGYQSETHAENTAQSMQKAGISWFGADGTFCYDKDASREPAGAQDLAEQFRPWLEGLWLMPVVLWANPENGRIAADSFNADSLIQSLVGDLLEMSLFTLLPFEGDLTYIVHGARRRIGVRGTEATVVPLPRFEGQRCSIGIGKLPSLGISLPKVAETALDVFKRQYGIEDESLVCDIEPLGKGANRGLKVRIQVMFLSIKATQDYGGILARVFQTRPWEEPWKALSSRIVPQLSPLNHPEEAGLDKGHRPVHILADILPGDASWNAQIGASLNVFSCFLPTSSEKNPVQVAEGAELTRLLACSRALDGGDFGLALASSASLSFELKRHAIPLYEAVLAKLGSRLDDLKGIHLVSASHHLAARPTGSNGELPFSRVDLRHQHWTRYSVPDAELGLRLEAEAAKLLLVKFDVKPNRIFRPVAEWLLKFSLAEAYSHREFDPSQSLWWRDNSSGEIFAVVNVGNGTKSGDVIPHRKRSVTLRSTLLPLRIDSKGQINSNDTTLHLSMGRPPIGRMKIPNEGGVVEWFDASEVDWLECDWTEAQIQAVHCSSLKRSEPINGKKLRLVTAAMAATDDIRGRVSDSAGTVLFFDEATELPKPSSSCPKLKLESCKPEDFDSEGRFRHSQRESKVVERTDSLRGSPSESKIAPEQKTPNQGQIQSVIPAVKGGFPRNREVWKLKSFKGEDRIDQYEEAGVGWHNERGFYLRDDGIRISVYARVSEVGDLGLLNRFAELRECPVDKDGNLPGMPWYPKGREV